MSTMSTPLALRFALVALLMCSHSLVHARTPHGRITRDDIVSNFPAHHAKRFQQALNTPPAHRAISNSLSSLLQVQLPLTPTFNPIDYGADPSGTRDSTAAFTALFHDLLTSFNHSHTMADGFIDLGGAIVDLQGGDYTISQPLVFPPCYGNARLQRGTLRASPSFPANGYLIRIGNESNGDLSELERQVQRYPTLAEFRRSSSSSSSSSSRPSAVASCHSDGQGVYVENIGIEQVLLDGSHVAAGAVVTNRVMGATLSELFIIGFNVAGITMIAGHETEVYNTWLAERFWDDPLWGNTKSIGVQILGNDHLLQQVIVFSANVGVKVIGAANLITSTHTWNKGYPTGIGIWMASPGYTQNRVSDSYLDFNHLVAESPEHLTVTNAFFLASTGMELRTVSGHTAIDGLVVSGCQWDDGGASDLAFTVDESRGGPFTSLSDVAMFANQFSGFSVRSTSSRATLHFLNSSNECLDLRPHLLFPQFALTSVQATASVNVSSSPVVPAVPAIAIMRGQRAPGVPANDMRSICVRASPAFTGTVDVEFDQSSRSWPKASKSTVESRPASAARVSWK